MEWLGPLHWPFWWLLCQITPYSLCHLWNHSKPLLISMAIHISITDTSSCLFPILQLPPRLTLAYNSEECWWQEEWIFSDFTHFAENFEFYQTKTNEKIYKLWWNRVVFVEIHGFSPFKNSLNIFKFSPQHVIIHFHEIFNISNQ